MSNSENIADRASDMVHDVTGDASRMIKEFRKNVNTMDTTSLFLTFGVTIVALILGIFVMNSVVGATSTYTDASGVKITYPSSYTLSDSGLATGTVGDIVVSSGIKSGDVSTKFLLSRVAVDANSPATATLGLVANDRTTTNGSQLNAFKVLDSIGYTGKDADKKPLEINGMPGYKVQYVYVTSSSNLSSGSIPKVIIGDDWLVRKGDKVYIFSLQSTEANRAAAQPVFESFVNSAQLP
jgi:hypothetical protein